MFRSLLAAENQGLSLVARRAGEADSQKMAAGGSFDKAVLSE
jgi:hypothetical protein